MSSASSLSIAECWHFVIASAVVAEIDPGIEGIIAYDIDMQAIRSARHNFDPAGHYARSDIFRVGVQRYRLDENAE